MDFAVLLDAPREPKTSIQIAKLGDDFDHGKYGKFAITTDDVATWKTNLAHLPGGRALIDEDHSADRVPRRTEASGWITDVALEGGVPTAKVEWTPKGKQAIEEGRYLFISPTYGKFKDEHGVEHDNTLIGAALTNRPFLNMPALTLASDERVSEAVTVELTHLLDTQLEQLDEMLQLNDEQLAIIRQLDVSAAERKQAASDGNALPDGSYPIRNAKELRSAAILAASGHGNVAAAKRLIRRRAKELGVDVTTLPGFGPSKSLDATPSDSRAAMDKALLTALGLDEDTELATALDSLELDEDAAKKLLDAATELRSKADKPAEPAEPTEDAKTLEQQAQENGQILLDADAVATLKRQATAGETAMKQLHEQRFEHAFTDALNDPKGARVSPAQKDGLHRFFELDADAAIKMIDESEPIVQAKPQGVPTIDLSSEELDPAEIAQAGVFPGSHELDQKIRAHMRENKLPESDYVKVLDQYQNGALVLS